MQTAVRPTNRPVPVNRAAPARPTQVTLATLDERAGVGARSLEPKGERLAGQRPRGRRGEAAGLELRGADLHLVRVETGTDRRRHVCGGVREVEVARDGIGGQPGDDDRGEAQALRVSELGRADRDCRAALVGEDQRRRRRVTRAPREVLAVPFEERDLTPEQLDGVVGAVRAPVAALLSVSTSIAMSMSTVSDARFGTLILNEITPASLFDATMVVMSGAAGFSPVESW